MKNRKTSVLLLVLILMTTVAVVTIAAKLHQQDNSVSERQKAFQKKFRAEDYPIADYDSKQPSDPQERDKRKARNQLYNLSDIRPENLSRFVLKESSPDILIPLQTSHPRTEPAIPVADSDAVVIGEVIGAQAYLSGDKTRVYSEFTVRVLDILKNSNNGTLYPEAEIAAQRSGGRIRFPSGKILLRGAPYGQNMPHIGQRYILFLKQSDEWQGYSIVTGYELRAGRIFPLDHQPEGDAKSNQFAEYEKYAGMDEATFINTVRAAFEKGEQK